MQTLLIQTVHESGQQLLILVFGYNKHLIYLARSIGARWNPERSRWQLPYSSHHLQQVRSAFNGYVKIKYPVGTIPKSIVPDRKKPVYKLTESHKGLIHRYQDYLTGIRYAQNTINTYVHLVSVFFTYIQKDVDQLVMEDIYQYNHSYIIQQRYSVSYQRQFVSALKLLFTHIESPSFNVDSLERPAKERKLPLILSKEEIRSILLSINNLKHKAILTTLYSSGLRVSELIHLRLVDIDSKRMLIRVRQSKGRKDRYVRLSDTNLLVLRHYVKKYKPKEMLIEGQEGLYSSTSIRNIFRRACSRAGIRKKVTPHTLRHSYATHMLELGVDLRYVQALLGHAKPETTMIYTHVSNQKLQSLANPLDALWEEELARDNQHILGPKLSLVPEKSWGYS